MHDVLQTLGHDMFHLPLPWSEKLIRPILLYLVLVVFVRLFGKRELAQLNPFDLIVLLCLSNTVQNAIIGDDNSVTGGVLGAFSLLAVNWVLSKLLFRMPALDAAIEGKKTTLIREGQVDEQAMKRETMTHEDLISVLNRNGFNDPYDVAECVLEPNGTFFVRGKSPSAGDLQSSELLRAIERLTDEVKAMQRRLDEHLDV
ncbi:MAG: DUF421 domain-containing protein [Acidobacteriaceae bacterium]|nr:DUF421 domain-containing protein [Acidobacteriaceae bacterium]